MFLRQTISQVLVPNRNFSKTQILRSGHGRPGLPGQNIPLNLDLSKTKMTLVFFFYFGVPLAAPWFVVWRNMTRES